MTNFLGAGFLTEGVETIQKNAQYLQKLMDMTEDEKNKLNEYFIENNQKTSYPNEIRKTLQLILEQSKYLADLICSLPCEPIIYTGKEKTDELISMLENLMNKNNLVQSTDREKII